MPMTLTFEGMEYVDRLLRQLGDKAEFVASQALYEGAGKMADAVSAEARNIQTAPFKYAKNGEYRLPSPEEKEIVTDSRAIGIAKFEKDGLNVQTSVGYNGAGYARVTWNHMSSKARTNYKAHRFKGLDNMTTSTLKAAGVYKRGEANMKPIGVVANAINSGTSFMRKQPFFRKGVNNGSKAAEAAIVGTAEKLFDRIINENEQESGGKTA